MNAKPPEEVVDRLDGPVGEALKALAEDIQTGEKSSETLTHIDSSGVLCLKWPDALNGYGLENKSILDELSRRNWLVLDPLSPFRKVVEIEIDGGKTWKVVRLQPVVKQLMAIGKTPPEPSTVSTSSADAVQLSKPVQGEIEGIGEDTRLALIQSIVTTLREGVREGILTADADGAFVWIQSRKAEPFLVERLQVNQMSIMRLGSVVPDVFMCQT
ncbi:MAG: hypothetical protein IPJ27_12165 [Candidatus Accumulibacter sp.]|uniref:Uncharacterized protein n=1 Tax=Candidatus Accumulibacter proximus TaxID=2954385 RepID=A0A935PZR5_9PROT|nr:hypothetical protein [Candidatus Accumulibacter proximus]